MNKFRILSIDGGGVRGYLSANILENIEKYLNSKSRQDIPIGKRFDLIVGTSTGAIIAGLLAIGKSAEEIRKIYENDITVVFGKNMKRSILGMSVFSKYHPNELQKKAQSYFEEKTFLDVTTDLVVTSVNVSTMSPKFHKSDFTDKNKQRADEKLASAIIASSSAPVYFPVARNLKYSDYLIDGGVVANNPAMVGLIDALTFERESKRGTPKPQKISNIQLLSIGTGKQTQIPYSLELLLNAGAIDWLVQPKLSEFKKSSPLIEILMASQSKLVEFQAKTLLETQGGSYRRINPELGSKIPLDDVNSFGKLKNVSDLTAEDIQWLNNYMIGDNK